MLVSLVPETAAAARVVGGLGLASYFKDRLVVV